MPNIELLEKTLEHIKQNQVGWDQSSWRFIEGLSEGKPELLPTPCGTAMCFAGEAITITNPDLWVITLDDIKKAKQTGNKNVMERMDWMIEYVRSDLDVGVKPTRPTHGFTHPLTNQPIKVWTASVFARSLLGLSVSDADELFNGENTLAQLESAVAHLKEYGSLDEWDRDEVLADA